MEGKLKGKPNGMLHRFAFALPCLLERKTVTCYGLLCMALLCFALSVGRELSQVTVCVALFVGEGSCHTLRFASFGLDLFARVRGKLSHVIICFALLCIA